MDRPQMILAGSAHLRKRMETMLQREGGTVTPFRFIVLAVVCLALSASAYAVVVPVPSVSELPAGWSLTVIADSEPRGSVTDKLWGADRTFQFTQGDKDKTARCWASAGTTNLDNVRLADITSLNIRV